VLVDDRVMGPLDGSLVAPPPSRLLWRMLGGRHWPDDPPTLPVAASPSFHIAASVILVR